MYVTRTRIKLGQHWWFYVICFSHSEGSGVIGCWGAPTKHHLSVLWRTLFGNPSCHYYINYTTHKATPCPHILYDICIYDKYNIWFDNIYMYIYVNILDTEYWGTKSNCMIVCTYTHIAWSSYKTFHQPLYPPVVQQIHHTGWMPNQVISGGVGMAVGTCEANFIKIQTLCRRSVSTYHYLPIHTSSQESALYQIASHTVSIGANQTRLNVKRLPLNNLRTMNSCARMELLRICAVQLQLPGSKSETQNRQRLPQDPQIPFPGSKSFAAPKQSSHPF